MATEARLRRWIEDHEHDEIDYDKLYAMDHATLLEWATRLQYSEPDYAPRNEIEVRDEVLDRLRGGPRAYLRELADNFEMSYDEFIGNLRSYANGETDYIRLGFDTPDYNMERMWDSFELVTGHPVPPNKRDYPFSCSC